MNFEEWMARADQTLRDSRKARERLRRVIRETERAR